MSDTDRLAEIREAATCLHEDGSIHVEQRGKLSCVTSQLYPLDSVSGVDVRWLCYTDTPEGGETIATLLRAVPHLLDEVAAAQETSRNQRAEATVTVDIRECVTGGVIGYRDGLDAAYAGCLETGRDPARDHMMSDYLISYTAVRSILAYIIKEEQGLTFEAAMVEAEREILAQVDYEFEVEVLPDGTFTVPDPDVDNVR